ncbi:MAG: hypothetical protein ACJ8D9_02985 [Xanthobacteraceae bacterium]|jgi:hypothetical protein
MRQMHIVRRLMVSGSVAAALFAVAGLSASAQDTTTTTTTTTAPSAADGGASCQACTGNKIPTSATPDMMQEACQRRKKRTDMFLQFGVREQFGSEEPFRWDKFTPCS